MILLMNIYQKAKKEGKKLKVLSEDDPIQECDYIEWGPCAFSIIESKYIGMTKREMFATFNNPFNKNYKMFRLIF